jgi:hypothetical protein
LSAELPRIVSEDRERVGSASRSLRSLVAPAAPDLLYVCEKCGVGMPADRNDDFICACGAMHLDVDAGRFGSRFGDDAILTYRRR